MPKQGTILCCAMVLLAASIAPTVAQSQIRATAKQAPSCFRYIELKAPPDQDKVAHYGNVQRCLAAIRKAATNVIEAERAGKDSVDVGAPDGKKIGMDNAREYLINQHAAYQALKKWVPGSKFAAKANDPTAWLNLNAELKNAGAEVHEALALFNLKELFSAVLTAGAIIGDGQNAEPQPGSDNNSTNGAATLVWESTHWGDDRKGRLDASLRGRLGFVPALTLVKPATTTTSTANDAQSGYQSEYQEAFAWDIGGRINVPIRSRTFSEITLTARVGQTNIGSGSVVVENGKQGTLYVPVANDAGSTEWYWDYGLEWNLYGRESDVVHGEGSIVSPLFSIGMYQRHDNRFKKEGDLVKFDSPERRMVFRFMIDALKVVDQRDLSQKPHTYALGFGVEHEFHGGSGQRVPSGTKWVFRGDIDLLRALRGR